jgi:superfamily II DNA or RNA helicase
MTRILLCAGPSLLVVNKDGTLFFRRPGQPDARVPYSPENYPVFLRSARQKHDLTPVIGPHGEAGPVLSEDATIPELRLEHLPTGEIVYRVAGETPAGRPGDRSPSSPGSATEGGGPGANIRVETAQAETSVSSTCARAADSAMPQGPLFHKGDTVVLRSTRELGRIENEPVRSQGDYWYRVQFGKRVDRVLEEDLEALDEADDSIQDLALHGRWGRIQAFRCALAVERMTRENRGTIYAYKAQRILFEPHQYKPLLKILDSPDRRLLIADEVGLGKTIEAGLILTELEARKPLERVLIVCPPRLRAKWREELNRKFDQPFDVMTKAGFQQYLDRVIDNPRRGRLRGVVSMNTLREEGLRERITGELGHLDLVIFDEAHHARNPETQTAGLLQDLCEVANCVLLLTATPIHLKSRDLFTLLQALRPSEFRDPNVFEMQLRQFACVHEASRRVRSLKPGLLPEGADLLARVFLHNLFTADRDPLAMQVIEDLRGTAPPDRRGWVELERRIQELHPLSSILTRSRKRDVQSHAPVRRPSVLRCRWSSQEWEAYDRLLGRTRGNGWLDHPYSLATIQKARQAASCLPAALQARAASVARDEEAALEQTDIPPDAVPRGADQAVSAPEGPDLTWHGTDSKFQLLLDLLQGIWQHEPGAKVLIFTFFVGTSSYLLRRLSEGGIQAIRIAGDVPSHPHDKRRDERGACLDRFRMDPEVQVLVSTEVGSEGLDFQFCHHLVNYDLPWNPMVVEQRIGRIDRFGQESDVVNIHNLVVEGTVEDRILHRLYDRIGIFRESIGDLEEILGETVSELQRDYLSGKLTPQEADRRVEEAAQAINRRRMNLERLEKSAGELFGHEEYLRDELNRVGHLGRFLTEQSLLAVLRSYLEAQHPGVAPWQDRPGIYGVRLTDALRQDIHDAARQAGATWFEPLESDHLLLTMQGDTAFRHPEVTLVNVTHPLMRAAVSHVRQQLEGPLARLGQARLNLRKKEAGELGQGTYFLAVFQQIVEGIRPRCIFDTVAWARGPRTIMDPEVGERLLHLVLEQADEWRNDTAAPAVPQDAWEVIEEEVRSRCRGLRERETRENEALYHRRKRVLVAEYDIERAVRERRLKTAEANRNERMLPAFRGQLQKLDTEHRARLAELEQQKSVSVRLSDPLAVCIVEVVEDPGAGRS